MVQSTIQYNMDKLMAFHHTAIRRMLGIKWNQVKEKQIKNKEVRGILWNIPNVDAFIIKRTATYLGNISLLDNSTYPKKFLAAWKTRK